LQAAVIDILIEELRSCASHFGQKAPRTAGFSLKENSPASQLAKSGELSSSANSNEEVLQSLKKQKVCRLCANVSMRETDTQTR
jgi:hypothetical protein